MARRKSIILAIAPRGIGGIASISQLVNRNWGAGDYSYKLWTVPRSSLRGLVSYVPNLVLFSTYVIFKPVALLHVNLASKGSPIRKYLYVKLAKLRGVPVVIQVHSGKFTDDLESDSTPLAWKSISRDLIKSVDAALVFTETQRQYLIDNNFFQPSLVQFFPNYVEIPRMEDLNQGATCFDFIFVGRFSFEKGAIDLIDALSMLSRPELRIAVVGAYNLPESMPSMKQQALDLGMEFFGELENKDALSLISKSKFLVLPSHSENFPMVILEAFARGRPVVATDVGGISKLISDAVGRLVPSQNSRFLSDAMRFLLDNPETVKVLGKNARKLAQENYDIKLYPEHFLQVIQRLGLLDQ